MRKSLSILFKSASPEGSRRSSAEYEPPSGRRVSFTDGDDDDAAASPAVAPARRLSHVERQNRMWGTSLFDEADSDDGGGSDGAGPAPSTHSTHSASSEGSEALDGLDLTFRDTVPKVDAWTFEEHARRTARLAARRAERAALAAGLKAAIAADRAACEALAKGVLERRSAYAELRGIADEDEAEDLLVREQRNSIMRRYDADGTGFALGDALDAWQATSADLVNGVALRHAQYRLEAEGLAPSAPGKPMATEQGPTSITLQWTAPKRNFATVSEYEVSMCRKTPAFLRRESDVWLVIEPPCPNDLCAGWTQSHELDDLEAGLPYRVRVRARNMAGPGPWSDILETATLKKGAGRRKSTIGDMLRAGGVDWIDDLWEEIQGLLRNDPQRVRKMFLAADEDGSGALSQDEIIALLGRLGVAVDGDARSFFFAEIDADNSGSITYEEFVNAVVRRRRSANRASFSGSAADSVVYESLRITFEERLLGMTCKEERGKIVVASVRRGAQAERLGVEVGDFVIGVADELFDDYWTPNLEALTKGVFKAKRPLLLNIERAVEHEVDDVNLDYDYGGGDSLGEPGQQSSGGGPVRSKIRFVFREEILGIEVELMFAPPPTALVVKAVKPGSAAMVRAMKVGDRILGLGDKAISTPPPEPPEFIQLVKDAPRPLAITVVRVEEGGVGAAAPDSSRRRSSLGMRSAAVAATAFRRPVVQSRAGGIARASCVVRAGTLYRPRPDEKPLAKFRRAGRAIMMAHRIVSGFREAAGLGRDHSAGPAEAELEDDAVIGALVDTMYVNLVFARKGPLGLKLDELHGELFVAEYTNACPAAVRRLGRAGDRIIGVNDKLWTEGSLSQEDFGKKAKKAGRPFTINIERAVSATGETLAGLNPTPQQSAMFAKSPFAFVDELPYHHPLSPPVPLDVTLTGPRAGLDFCPSSARPGSALFVSRVLPNSVAVRKGVRPHDRVVGINGDPKYARFSRDEFIAALKDMDRPLVLNLDRSSRPLDAAAALADAHGHYAVDWDDASKTTELVRVEFDFEKLGLLLAERGPRLFVAGITDEAATEDIAVFDRVAKIHDADVPLGTTRAEFVKTLAKTKRPFIVTFERLVPPRPETPHESDSDDSDGGEESHEYTRRGSLLKKRVQLSDWDNPKTRSAAVDVECPLHNIGVELADRDHRVYVVGTAPGVAENFRYGDRVIGLGGKWFPREGAAPDKKGGKKKKAPTADQVMALLAKAGRPIVVNTERISHHESAAGRLRGAMSTVMSMTRLGGLGKNRPSGKGDESEAPMAPEMELAAVEIDTRDVGFAVAQNGRGQLLVASVAAGGGAHKKEIYVGDRLAGLGAETWEFDLTPDQFKKRLAGATARPLTVRLERQRRPSVEGLEAGLQLWPVHAKLPPPPKQKKKKQNKGGKGDADAAGGMVFEESTAGVRVAEVSGGGPAVVAGVMPEDIVVGVAGAELSGRTRAKTVAAAVAAAVAKSAKAQAYAQLDLVRVAPTRLFRATVREETKLGIELERRPEGLFVEAVKHASQAHRLGVRRGDRFVGLWSHHPIKLTTTRHELVKMLSAAKRPLTLRMMRLSAVRRTFAVEFSGGEELGFTIGEQAGWYVSALAPGSPAAKQGAVVGDEVVGINGTQIPAAPTKAELIRRIVNAHEKEGPFTLDLMRMRVETEKHTRRFEGTVLGATIANAPHGFVVAALAEGGAAAELGVAPGDVLVSINGEKVGQGAAAEESRSKKDKKKKKAVSKPGGLVPLSTCADVVGYIVAELAADTDLDIEFERRVPCPEPGGAAGEAEDAASQEGPADGGLAASSADPVEAAQARAAACATQVEASSQKVNAAATSGGPAALIVAVNAHKALMEEKRFADAAVTRAKRVAAGETPVSSFAATRAASLRSTSSGACTPKQAAPPIQLSLGGAGGAPVSEETEEVRRRSSQILEKRQQAALYHKDPLTGHHVSFWHDIPLLPASADPEALPPASPGAAPPITLTLVGDGAAAAAPETQPDNLVNFICEIPKYGAERWSAALKDDGNPLKPELSSAGEPLRYARPLVFNYGCLPRTWMDPSRIQNETGLCGDNDQVDVCEIGLRALPRGAVTAVKILGSVCVIADGKADYQLVAIAADDAWAATLHDVEDVKRLLPGTLETLVVWWKSHKIPDGDGETQMWRDGAAIGAAAAWRVVADAHHRWRLLVGAEETDAAGPQALDPIVLCLALPESTPADPSVAADGAAVPEIARRADASEKAAAAAVRAAGASGKHLPAKPRVVWQKVDRAPDDFPESEPTAGGGSQDKVFFLDERGHRRSYWHDVKLVATSAARSAVAASVRLHFVCEMPKHTRPKLSMDVRGEDTGIAVKRKQGEPVYAPRAVSFNYGTFPRTWMSDTYRHPDVAHLGTEEDGLDVIDIGLRAVPSGQVRRVKLLGCFCVDDRGSADWKCVVIDDADPWSKRLNDTDDVAALLPGTLEAAVEWFTTAVPGETGGPPPLELALDGGVRGLDYALGVVHLALLGWLEVVASIFAEQDDDDEQIMSPIRLLLWFPPVARFQRDSAKADRIAIEKLDATKAASSQQRPAMRRRDSLMATPSAKQEAEAAGLDAYEVALPGKRLGLTLASMGGKTVVDRLVAAGAAEMAGVRAGDVVLAINGAAVGAKESAGEVSSRLARATRPVSVTLSRGLRI